MGKRFGTLERGKDFTILEENTTGAGSKSNAIGILADSVLVSLFVRNITGSLVVNLYTQTADGEEALILSMPEVSAATPELIIRRAGPSMDRIRVEAIYSGPCDYSVRVRGTIAAEQALVKTPTIQNITMDDKNTEYSIVIPTNTKRFGLRTRNDAILKASYILGESNINYFTISYGMWYNERNLDGSGLTLYLQSNKDLTVLEVLSWE